MAARRFADSTARSTFGDERRCASITLAGFALTIATVNAIVTATGAAQIALTASTFSGGPDGLRRLILETVNNQGPNKADKTKRDNRSEHEILLRWPIAILATDKRKKGKANGEE